MKRVKSSPCWGRTWRGPAPQLAKGRFLHFQRHLLEYLNIQWSICLICLFFVLKYSKVLWRNWLLIDFYVSTELTFYLIDLFYCVRAAKVGMCFVHQFMPQLMKSNYSKWPYIKTQLSWKFTFKPRNWQKVVTVCTVLVEAFSQIINLSLKVFEILCCFGEIIICVIK